MNKKIQIAVVVGILIVASFFYMWRISDKRQDVSMPPRVPVETIDKKPSEKQPATVSAQDERLAESYIKANISTLSPEKEVLGGKYFVTDIAFTAANKGVVKYEDGHNAHEAEFEYSIEAGVVKITKFDVLKQ